MLQKKIEEIIRRNILRLSYFLFSPLPIKKNKIVFASYKIEELSGNFKYIYKELQKSDNKFKCTLFINKFSNSFKGKIQFLIYLIKAMYHLSTASYFIINDYFYPIYIIKPKKGIKIIQVWHACGAFKKFGYSIIDKKFGANQNFVDKVKIHSNYNYVLVSSKNIIPFYAEAFDIDPNKILSIGIPRTDIFYDKLYQDKIIKKIYKKFPEAKNKKIITYAPTFRGKNQFEANYICNLDFRLLKKYLSDEYVIFIKLHPYIADQFIMEKDLEGFVFDLSKYPEMNDILLVTDILITDYSSVVFEFSILEKPIIMYPLDLEGYMDERDFYYPYKEFVPGPIANNTKEIIRLIMENNFDRERIIKFKKCFFDLLDNNSSKRFVEKILFQNEGYNE